MVNPLLIPAMGVLSDLIDRVLPNNTEREKTKLEYEAKLTAAVTSLDVAQIETNKVEAASASLFVAGWRPAAGWLGVFGLAYHAILQPFLVFLCAVFKYPVVLPAFDNTILGFVLTGMLGLGTLRSYDKRQETDTKVVLPWLKRNKDE